MMTTTKPTTQYASWPIDFASVDMPWGTEWINTTWPFIAVSAPESKTDKAIMYHTEDASWPYRDFLMTKQADGTYHISR